ncbi:MAG: hypothetical protein ACLUOF_08145 [Ruminococcus sp.]
MSSPVRKIDVYHVLFTATNDYIYYRTDAKWSSYGHTAFTATPFSVWACTYFL